MSELSAGQRLLLRAMSQFGGQEESGSGCNPEVAKFLMAAGLPANDDLAWCSAFLYWCAEQENLERPPVGIAPSAKSWLRTGTVPPTPEQGDIVILSRDGAAMIASAASSMARVFP